MLPLPLDLSNPSSFTVVSINNVNIAGESFFWSLVTRRSNQRAGTRLFCRGVDENGYVANFVETEQIVEYNGDVVSFVQVSHSC